MTTAVSIGDLVTAWRVELSEGMQRLAQVPAAVNRVEAQVAASMRKASSSIDSAVSALATGMGRQLDRFGAFAAEHKAQLVAIAAATTLTAVKAEREYGRWETAAKNVQNITSMTTAELQALEAQLLDLPGALGKPIDMMRGLYQVLSSGVPRDNAVEFLVANAKAATGNLAELTTTINASTSVMAAYGLEINELVPVLDAMTKTVDLGKLTFTDLADNIGKGIAIAAQAGVAYEELFATVATLTLGGLSVEESMTAVRNILVSTIAPSTEAAKAIAEAGVEMSLATVKSQGLAGMMGNVAKAVQGNAEATAALFPNIRALNGAMALSSETGLARFKETLDAIEGSTGKVESNFANMADGIEGRAKQLGAELSKAWIGIGREMSVGVKPIIESLTAVLKLFNDMPGPVKAATGAIMALIPIIAALGLAVVPLGKGIAVVAGALTALGGPAAGIGTALAGVSGGAALATTGVVAAGAAIGLAIGTLINDVTGLRDIFATTKDPATEFAEALAGSAERYERVREQTEKLRESLGLTGEEWETSAERTAENARQLGAVNQKLLELAKAQREQRIEEQRTNESRKTAITVGDDLAENIDKQTGAVTRNIDELKKYYKLFDEADLRREAAQLAADFKAALDAGLPVQLLFERFGPAVDALAEKYRKIPEAKIPDELKRISEAFSLGLAGVQLEAYRVQREAIEKTKEVTERVIELHRTATGEIMTEVTVPFNAIEKAQGHMVEVIQDADGKLRAVWDQQGAALVDLHGKVRLAGEAVAELPATTADATGRVAGAMADNAATISVEMSGAISKGAQDGVAAAEQQLTEFASKDREIVVRVRVDTAEAQRMLDALNSGLIPTEGYAR